VDSNTVLVTLDVTCVPDAPIAADDVYTATEDMTFSQSAPGVLDNDSDGDGDGLTAVLDTTVATGTLSFNINGSFIYTPTLNFCGIDSFTYHATDGSLDSSAAMVTLDVACVNDAPIATGESYTTTEDMPLTGVAPGVLGNDSDVDGDGLTAVLDTDVTSGTLALSSDGSFVYTPNNNYCGPDSFTYHAFDGQANSNNVSVMIEIACVNDAPVAGDDAYNTSEDTPLTISAPGILTNDSDVEGSSLTAVLDTTVTTGTLSFNSNGSFTYTSPANWYGVTTFTYHAHDGLLASNTAVVTLTVTSINKPPIAFVDSYTATEDIVLSVAVSGVLSNDMDMEGDILTAVLDSDVTTGTLTLNSNGSFVYTPTLNFCGTDSFSYHAHDGQAGSNIAAVALHVTCVNDAPMAMADSYSVWEDSSLNSLSVLANDSDVEGDTLSLTAVTSPTNGTATLSGTAILYTPNANFAGMDVFTYTVSDGQLTDTAVVTLSVDNQNDAPTAVDDSYSIDEDSGSQVLDVLANDNDIDVGDSLSVTAVAVPTNGTAVLSGTIILYTPAFNFFGTDVFSYTISDGQLTDTAVVTVMVNAVNDAPTAVADSYTIDQNSSNNVLTVLGNDSDIEGDTLTIVSVSGVENGTAVISGTTILYTPNLGFVGSDTLTYTISDGELTATATVTITVVQVESGFVIYLPFVTKP
jgi:VCBS repeat-containing protein